MSGSRTAQPGSLYLPSLDGMRFIAFALVLVHHLPLLRGSPVMATLKAYGWVGVEMFFVISAYLFFYLLRAEETKTGSISVRRFYARRFLRIYPLMAAFAIAMALIYGWGNPTGPYRLAGVLLGMDNLMAWIRGYNQGLYASAHLWTLSFEFQIYAIIPVAYICYRRLGPSKFAVALVAVAVFCMCARAAFFGLGARHPIVWVTPFLRPESVLLGIAMSIYRPAWHWGFSAAVALLAGYLFLSFRFPWQSATASLVQYPLAALMCASSVDTALRCGALQRVLAFGPLRALGTISFGLYVFHYWCIELGRKIVVHLGLLAGSVGLTGSYLALAAVTFLLTLAMATVSYWLLERPLLRVKSRVSSVEGRPLASQSI